MSLYKRWLDIERATGRPLTAILDDLNVACGTKYQSNWPSVMEGRDFSLERLPTDVRRYMMLKVLPVELGTMGISVDSEKINNLVVNLT